MIKRALISVFYKDGILELAKFLQDRGVEIISTGGTFRHLKENGINVVEVSDVTGFDEILDGRVKTLHPIIHGGILAIRDNKEHMDTINEKGIKPIDLVVVNLYPFFEKVDADLSFEEKVEFIDIGGPTMLRSAAKNFQDVLVLSDTNDYKEVMDQIEKNGDVDYDTRKKCAGKVFNLMSAYDGAISRFFLEDVEYPEYFSMSLKKAMDLRYGENPHQTAAFYTSTTGKASMKDFEQLNGKALSYNNFKDMDIAWKTVWEFDEIACCGLKHNSPCGVAVADNVYDAYVRAYAGDPVSIFGGIIAFNSKVDKKAAEEMAKIFFEIVIAPDYDDDALEVLKKKKNLRVIKCAVKPSDKYDLAKVDGGILVQSTDDKLVDEVKVVTEAQPSEKEMKDMLFGMKVIKLVKSNAVLLAKDGKTIAVGGGSVNRIWPTQDVLKRAQEKGELEGAVFVSDAYFPFRDVVAEIAKYGIKVIVQPGGSIRDQESIDECNKHGIAMVFTGLRHFKH